MKYALRLGRFLTPSDRAFAVLIVIWGIVFLLPPSLFTGPGGRPYGAMADFAPEQVWGLCMLAIGGAHLAGSLLYDRMRLARTRARRLVMVTMSALYAFMAWMFFLIDPSLVGPYIWWAASLITMLQLWVIEAER